MSEPKQIVFIYGGNRENGEVVSDMLGEEGVPIKGGVISRRDQRWKVVEIQEQRTVTGPKYVPVFWVYLQKY